MVRDQLFVDSDVVAISLLFWSSLITIRMPISFEILLITSLLVNCTMAVGLLRFYLDQRRSRRNLTTLHQAFAQQEQELEDAETFLRQERAGRQHLQTELRASELRYNTLLERMNEGMVIVDNEGTIQFANTRYCELLGYDRDELIGRNEREFVVTHDEQLRLAQKQELRQQGVHDQYEIQVRRKSGAVAWWLISGAPLVNVDGVVIGSIGIQTDITDYKRTEEALRFSEQKYRTLVEQIPAITYINQLQIEPTLQIQNLYVSPQLGTWLGYLPDQDSATLETWPLHIYSEDSDRIRLALQQAWQSQTPFAQEYRLQTTTGTTIWVRDEAVVIVDPETGHSRFLQGVMLDITDRKRAEEELRASEQKYRTLIERMNEGIVVVNHDGEIQFANDRYCQMSGYNQAELLGINEQELTATESDRQLVATKTKLRQQGIYDQYEVQVRKKLGDMRWWLISGTPVFDADGTAVGSMGILTDITERKKAEEALRKAEEKYRSIFEHAAEGIFQISPDGAFLSANPALANILGYESADDLMAQIGDIDRQLYVDEAQRAKLKYRLQKQGAIADFESQVYRSDGSIIWVSESIRAVFDKSNNLLYYEGTLKDITLRRRAEEQLLHNAFYDPLTGLANRALFMERLNHALIQAKVHSDQWFAILCIDLDRFKVINDSLGQTVGDQLLIEIARRLEALLSPEHLIARLGGDEFAVLLENMRSVVDVTRTVEHIQADLMSPFHLKTHEVFVTASIGIALSNHNAAGHPYDRADDLLRDADTAMYRAKYMGKACYKIFDRTMHTNTVTKLQLETQFRRAIARQELRLHYQPIIELSRGWLAGFEVLVRWQHPEQGLLLPRDFIPLAEETGLIVPMGEWVLKTATQQLNDWQTCGLASPHLVLHINLAGKQFSQRNLTAKIASILSDTNLSPENLSLEITEDVIMENVDTATATLEEIRALGIRLCIDDFGTGYSSLSRLHAFPINTLKIDYSFIQKLADTLEHREIVQTIINLARNLGMDVVAEGVETPEQLEQLKALQCDYGQGYLFAPALNVEQVVPLLVNQTNLYVPWQPTLSDLS